MSNIWLNYGGKGLKFGSGIKVSVQPGLPPIAQKTLRIRFYDSFNPLTDMPDRSDMGMTWTSYGDNIYDFHYDNTSWTLTSYQSPTGNPGGVFNAYGIRSSGGSGWVYPMTQHELDIIDSDLTGVTDISQLLASAWRARNCLFYHLESVTTGYRAFAHGSRAMYLTSINDLNMPALTNAEQMFWRCSNLTGKLPFVTAPNLTNVSGMYGGCSGVTSGAVDMYNYLSTKSVTVTSHESCFSNCSTAEERAQIPTSWGGTLS